MDRCAVVEFLNEQSVSVVSSKWMNKSLTLCQWPDGPNKVDWVKNHKVPLQTWPIYAVKVLKFYGKVKFK